MITDKKAGMGHPLIHLHPRDGFKCPQGCRWHTGGAINMEDTREHIRGDVRPPDYFLGSRQGNHGWVQIGGNGYDDAFCEPLLGYDKSLPKTGDGPFLLCGMSRDSYVGKLAATKSAH